MLKEYGIDVQRLFPEMIADQEVFNDEYLKWKFSV